jgi:hypothetical protein
MTPAIRGTNITVFLLFFGIALLDALGSGRWYMLIFWLVIGSIFLRADVLHREPPTPGGTGRA